MTRAPAGTPVEVDQVLPLLAVTLTGAPAGLHRIRVPLADKATVPPPVTPAGCLAGAAQLVPPLVEEARQIVPASQLPTRTTVAGASSAKSMSVDVGQSGAWKVALGTAVRLSWRKPLRSASADS